MSHVRRRQFLIAAAGLAALALPALAQQEKRVRRIGYLSGSNAQVNAGRLAAFRQGMTELRWVEGRDYAIDARHAHGVSQAQADLAAELIASKPDLLLASADVGTRLFAQGTKTIPIVFVFASDPVGLGVAASLPRPGGNATGVMGLARDLAAKRLQLLKEVFPRITHVVVLFASDAIGLPQVNEIQEAAPRLKMRVTTIELREAADIVPAFKRGAALGAQAYIVAQGPLVRRQLPPRGDLRRQNLQGCEARGPAYRAADQVRAGGQPQDREGAGHQNPTVGPRTRRPGDRVAVENCGN